VSTRFDEPGWELRGDEAADRLEDIGVAPGKRTRSSASAPLRGPRLAVGKRPARAFLARDAEVGAPAPPQRLPAAVRSALQSSDGDPLPDPARWSRVMGVDLHAARLVQGTTASAAAAALGARAFTVGERIFFGEGQRTAGGDSLLRHELTHVAQQQGATVPDADDLQVASPGDDVEHEARANAGAEPAAAPAAGRSAMLAMDGEDRATESQYTDRWFIGYPHGIFNDAREQISRLPFPAPAYCHWLWGRNDAVIFTAFGAMMDRAEFQRICGGDYHSAVNRGRDATPDGLGTREWVPAVGREIAGLLAPKFADSIRRLGAQYAAAAYQAWLAAPPERREDHSRDIPIAAGVLRPSQPLDRHVIAALINQEGSNVRQLVVNYEEYGRNVGSGGAAAVLRGPRPIRGWSFDIRAGAITWIQVTDPREATAQDVAALLYGDESSANQIVAAPPRFGFRPDRLLPDHATRWRREVLASPWAEVVGHRDGAEALALGNTLREGRNPDIDPAAEVIRAGGAVADDAALAQAGAFRATGASSGDILERFDLALSLIDSIEASLGAMSGFIRTVNVAPVRQRIQERKTRLRASTTPADVLRWDAHSAAEFDVLRRAATGINNAAQQYRQFTGGTTGGASAAELANHIRIPIFRMARAYHVAAAVAEMPDTAQQRLADADRQAQLFPIEMVEGVLAVCRLELERARSAGDSAYASEVPDLSAEEERLRTMLFEAREQIAINPTAAQQRIDEALRLVGTLQEKVTMISTLATLWQEWGALLHNSHTVAGIFTGKNARYETQMGKLQTWQDELWSIYLDYKFARGEDGLAAARQRWAGLRARGDQLTRDINETAALFEEEENRERWINFGARVAVMIGIAVATMGVGAYVEGALLVGAGWGMTATGTLGAAVVSTGAEAATFTAATNLIFEEDHSIRHLLGSFAENWILFGAMRGLSFVVEGAIGTTLGAEAARGAIGQVANMTTGLSANIAYAMMRADQEARAHGQPNGLTDEQKHQLVLENVVVFIGTVIAARYARGFLEGISRAGAEGPLARLATIDESRASALRLAREAQSLKSLEAARNAISQDSTTLRSEIDVLRELEHWAQENPTRAARLGLSPERLAHIRTIDEAALNTRERASIALELEAVGGDLYQVRAELFDEVVGRLERLGDRVERSVNAEGQRQARARSADGTSMTIRERVSARRGAATAGTTRVEPGGPPAPGEPARIRPTDTASHPEGARDVERWQTHALETDPRGAEAMADPQFREYYARWMEMPDRLSYDAAGHPIIRFPEGTPPEVQTRITNMVNRDGNVGLMTRAVARGAEIHQALVELGFPDPSAIDPRSEAWNRARNELQRRFGRPAVRAYEESVLSRYGDRARAALDDRVHSILRDGALDILRSAFPDCQIYLTGSMTQASKAGVDVTDVDVILVVPEGTPIEVRAAMEERAAGMRLPTSEAYRDEAARRGRPHADTLEVDPKAMTPQEYAGWAMTPTAPGRTPLRNLRIDTTTPGARPGMTGVDLHNHMMGVTNTDYFVNRAGGGSSVTLLGRALELCNNPPEPIAPGVVAEVRRGHAEVEAMRGDGHSTPEQIESRAHAIMDSVLRASDVAAFDHTYTLRDLLVGRHIDPSGPYRTYARDVVETLAREGVNYSEQSVSMGKLERRFTPEVMRAIHEELRARGLDSDVRFLAMLGTRGTLSADGTAAGRDAFHADLARLRPLLERGDVAGADIAGPEASSFTSAGMENFRELYRTLREVGLRRGRPLVLRPHVGEGYHEVDGAPEDTAHAELAHRNLEMLIRALREVGHTGNPAHDGVVVRFGHATHADSAQIHALAELGITVEANIGSNLATGSIASASDHPLLYNLFWGTRTVLATDAEGVMGTTLSVEYERASELIERFRSNRVALEINGRRVFFRDIHDPAVRNRFSIDQLHRWAQEYRESIAAGDTHDSARTGP